MQAHAAVVAVERHHVARRGEVHHQLQLLGVAVARGVDGRVAGGDHVRAELVDPVDRLVHGALVARDRRGREEDRVAVVEVDVRVVAVRHPPERRERLALTSGRDHDELVVREVLDLAHADQHSLRDLDVAELAPDVHVLAHRAAHQRDLAPHRLGGIDDLLHAVDVRGEGGHDDPAVAAVERLLEVRTDARLRRRDAGPIHIGRVAAQEQQPVPAELGESRHVGGLAVDGRLVELVVAGYQRGA